MSVVVVGAGLAGLAAASELVRHGFDVTVLEASGRVGGRMTSDEIDGVVVDRGAQFLSSAYEHVLSLCREASLESTLEETSPWIAVVRGGEVRRASYAHPLSFVGGGPLTWREGLRLGRRRAKLGRTLAQLPLSDYSAWHEHDDEDAGEWCRRVFGRGVADHLFAPLVEGFYFQSLDGMSKALPLALMQFGSRRPRTVTLRGGIGALPEALASRLDVTLDTSVERVEVAAGGVRVHLADHTLDCERVILATTASVAARLYPAACPLEQELLATRYSSTINIAIAAQPGWHPPSRLRDVYGLLVPRAERHHVAAVGIESRKSAFHTRTGELLDVMLAGDVAGALLKLPDDEVVRSVLRELERHFPDLRDAVRFTRCFRWPEAEPCSPPGRSRAIAAYRRSLPANSRMLLAGDYTGMPFTEGAAEAGIWAASRLAAAP